MIVCRAMLPSTIPTFPICKHRSSRVRRSTRRSGICRRRSGMSFYCGGGNLRTARLRSAWVYRRRRRPGSTSARSQISGASSIRWRADPAMPDRDRQLIEAAMCYLTLLDGDSPVSVEQFVAATDPELRSELRPYLEEILALGMPVDPPVLSPAEHALAAGVGQDVNTRLTRALTGSVFAGLSEARAACKLSLGALAQQLNIPPDLLARIERRDITLSTI